MTDLALKMPPASLSIYLTLLTSKIENLKANHEIFKIKKCKKFCSKKCKIYQYP